MRQFDAGTEPWLAELAMKWQDVAGDPVSRHTRPGHFEGSCLTVFVDSSAWLNELSRFGTEQMKENIQAHLDNDRVKTVRLRIDPEK